MGERALLRPVDDHYLADVVGKALAPARLTLEDVVAAGRAAYTWLTVDADVERCLGRAPDAVAAPPRPEPDRTSRDAGPDGRWLPCRGG